MLYIDPIIEEIHKIREDYARQFDFDMDKICKDMQQRQLHSGHQLVSFARQSDLHKETNNV